MLQLIGPKEFLLQLGSVFRDELLRVRLFNFAGEILIKKKKSSDWICAAKNVLSFFFFPLLVLLVALQELGVQLEH